MSNVNDGDEEEDWEGTVGQLKACIESATSILETNLINAVEEMSRKNTEKIVENVTKSNKTELDVIDAVKSMLATEAVLIREHVEKQLFEESQKVKKQFDQTQERLHKHSIIVEEQF